jgi:hypothetical protein
MKIKYVEKAMTSIMVTSQDLPKGSEESQKNTDHCPIIQAGSSR